MSNGYITVFQAIRLLKDNGKFHQNMEQKKFLIIHDSVIYKLNKNNAIKVKKFINK
jgi:hypothetical protein